MQNCIEHLHAYAFTFLQVIMVLLLFFAFLISMAWEGCVRLFSFHLKQHTPSIQRHDK